jgi:hypothetical protein
MSADAAMRDPGNDSPRRRSAALGTEAPLCTVCNGRLGLLGRREQWTYAACAECGAVQLVPQPEESELGELYRDQYHHGGHYHEDPESLLKERGRVIDQVADTVAAIGINRTVVEIGAGWCGLGRVLTGRGFEYVGLEPNRDMADYGRSKGLDVRPGGIEVLEANPSLAANLGVIVTMAVYEHLLDQCGMLRRMASLLPADGAIVLQAPTAGFPRAVGEVLRRIAPQRQLPSVFGSLAPPWHVCLPTPKSLRIQAASCGLTVSSVTASLSGRRSDWRRFLQAANEMLGVTGHSLFGERWPLSMAHLFVLRPEKSLRLASRTPDRGSA